MGVRVQVPLLTPYRVFHNGNESERIAHTNKWREVSLAVIGSSPIHSTINPLPKAKVNSQGQNCADLSKNKFALLARWGLATLSKFWNKGLECGQ